MEVRFALVLDDDATLDPINWRVAVIAPSRAALHLEHDGHVILIPRKPDDRRVENVTAVHMTSRAESPAGVYRIG
jgi:hypothetical protein